MTDAMVSHFGGGLLYCLGNEKLPPQEQDENGLEIRRFFLPEKNYLLRANLFSMQLHDLLESQPALRLAHFRDVWSGIAILEHKHRLKTLFEVNALPSIELKYHYPEITETTLAKIRSIEDHCLAESDRIVVPSGVIRDFIEKRGTDPGKISLISNGAETGVTTDILPKKIPGKKYILYFGALQSWQGVQVLLKAFAGLADKKDLMLVMCISHKPRYAKEAIKYANKLGLEKKVHWEYQLKKSVLNEWIAGAELTVAPLTECDRNLEQGCCPLKIVESMAMGIPVVASDLPVCRELIDDGVDGRLVRADRPATLSRMIRSMLDYPEKTRQLGQSARSKIIDGFSWSAKKEELTDLYDYLLQNH